MVVLGWWLDLMILEVFSNLWFYDSMITKLLQENLTWKMQVANNKKKYIICIIW